MKEQWIDTTIGRLYTQSAGSESAPVVLGLHGMSRRNGWHTWQPLMEPLAEAGFRVVGFDMPGWGQSPPLHERPLSHGEAITVILALLDALNTSRVAGMLGKSWGGGLALEIALSHPERVAALVLSAPAFTEFDRLTTLRPPVLLAWAEDDPTIPVAYASRYDSVPRLTRCIYPTGGHSAATKNVPAFAPIAIDFLTSNNNTVAHRQTITENNNE